MQSAVVGRENGGSGFAPVALGQLPLGARLSAPIYDERNTKLLAAGLEITEQLLEGLKRRSINTVVISQQDYARLSAFSSQGSQRNAAADRPNVRQAYVSEMSRQLDNFATLADEVLLQAASDPFSAQLAPRRAVAFDTEWTVHLATSHESEVSRVEDMFTEVEQGDSSSIAAAVDQVQLTLDQIVSDIDAFVCLGACPAGTDYPSRHSRHAAMLAMAMATSLGLDETTVKTVGIGTLIHDLGMLTVDRRLIDARGSLTDEQFSELTAHPVKTLELVERHLAHIPPNARLIAYQMHERGDGSGYPRGRKMDQTHPLSRLAMVADSFAALVAPRPHRAGLQPYFAIERMLDDTRRGKFDPRAVRALLQTTSLFPIGSLVELSNGYVGRVIRSNGLEFGSPMVEAWRRGNLTSTPAVIDLLNERKVHVVKALISLE